MNALKDNPLGLDTAVLLRQCLRFVRQDNPLTVAHLPHEVLSLLHTVGIEQHLDGTLEAVAYYPTWLNEPEAPELDAPPRELTTVADEIPAEPWVQRLLGRSHWKSPAQREAAWLALNSDANATLLIGLPTGSGKSLVYQARAAFEPGLTLVIVPTVALGLDQVNALQGSPLAEACNPRLYASGENQEAVIEAVAARTCRLLITSPEACTSGRLRGVLSSLAADGWLRTVVVDEAHIIESWGSSFRIEFQLLGALVSEWRDLSPQGMRVLLLSATFTLATADLLKRLFWRSGAPWIPFVLKQLRPEIRYFSPGKSLSEADKKHALLEAISRLPRPAIVYVTEKPDAEALYARLQELGYQRLACFHGDTRPKARERIMLEWREDRLDLVIATSAFGMGVDKPDVRAVIHACHPENIDRFYQEVGRGGRDGAPSISLALWTTHDQRVASRLGPTLINDAAKIAGRWRALWGTRKADSSHFRVLLNPQSSHLLGSRSYEENIRWNKRLLMMMHRADILRVEGLFVDLTEDDEPIPGALITPLVPTLGLEEVLPDLLRDARDSERQTLDASRSALDRVLCLKEAPCRMLRGHYGRDTKRACGSCVLCRRGSEYPVAPSAPQFDDDSPATSPTVDVIEAPSIRTVSGHSAVILLLRRILIAGLTNRFILCARDVPGAMDIFAEAAKGFPRPYRIDLLRTAVAQSISPNESTVVLHFDGIDDHAKSFNHRGARCSHLVFGTIIETNGVWPFLHDSHSRPFQGKEALDRWIASCTA